MKRIDLVMSFRLKFLCAYFSLSLSLFLADNRSFQPRTSARAIDVGDINVGVQTNSLTSQQRLVVYQFLSTGIYVSPVYTASV